MQFWKAHGTANDFVVLRDTDDHLDLSEVLVRALCDRRQGVGGDGVLRIGGARDGADVFMDYRNADGTIVEMCGNGVRVVAKHAIDHGLVTGDEVAIATRDGIKHVTVERGADGKVTAATVDMGPPRLAPAEVPFHAEDADALVHRLAVDGEYVELVAVSMGNPHAVLLVDDVVSAPVRELGPRLETDERFPEHTNVEFAEVVDPARIRLRVWERGVGETAACGTGACATLVALQRRGVTGEQADLEVPGGTLTVRYRPDEHPSVFLTGPAVEVASGELDEAWLEAANAGHFDREVLS